MIIFNFPYFKLNKKTYLRIILCKSQVMQEQKTLTVHPKTKEEFDALKAFMKALKIKFEISKEESYDPDFVAKIEKSRQDFKEGKGKTMTVEELNNLWK